MISQHDLIYNDGLREILRDGELRTDRTGVGTISKFGLRQVYDLSKSCPALTGKQLAFKAVKSELLWFMEGSGDERRLAEILHGTRSMTKTTIWTQNQQDPKWQTKAKFEGDLGRVYGVQWRSWTTPSGNVVDQLQRLVDGIKNDPFSRRHIISAWNAGELDLMALPPCHCFAQWYVTNDGRLDCQMYQRSNDFFLGCPFNIASYALMTEMLAQVCNLKAGRLLHITGDGHIYSNHREQVDLQLSRTPYHAPILSLNPDVKDITKFTMDDIALVNYTCHPTIKAPMAV